jgi:hypothetical protein
MGTRRNFMVVTVLLVAVGARLGWTHYRQLVVGERVTQAAQQLVGTLSDSQKTAAVLALDTPQRVDWHFIPKASRKGLELNEMSAAQREATESLLRGVLSEIGYSKATQIMQLEGLLRELESGREGGPVRDPLRYYITFFGSPVHDGRWGLSIEGHHLSLNFLIDHDKFVSSTPQFFGANPATVRTGNESGIPVGTRVLRKEEALAFELLDSLSGEQRAGAILSAEAPREIRAAGEPQPPQVAPEGIAWRDLSRPQRGILRRLMNAYLEAMPPSVREARVAARDEAGLGGIHFAWAGSTVPGQGHYYRVQGPTFLIEFVNTQPDAAGNPANHIHCVWRDMSGDFGLPLAQR